MTKMMKWNFGWLLAGCLFYVFMFFKGMDRSTKYFLVSFIVFHLIVIIIDCLIGNFRLDKNEEK